MRWVLLAAAGLAGWCVSAWGAEGQLGSARVVGASEFVVGSTGSFEIEYTAGPAGITVGGGVGASLMHAVSMRFGTNPAQAGYVKVTREGGGGLAVQSVEHPARGVLVPRKNWRHASHVTRHTLFAKVTGEPVKPGEKLRFTFGADSKPITFSTDPVDNPFWMVVDAKGDGKYVALEEPPRLRVVGGDLDHFFVTVPATRVVGEKADICIRGEDRFDNLAPGCTAEVMLSGIPGLPQKPVKLADGLARVEVPVARAGVHRVTVKGAGRSARSNPMVVTSEKPEYHVYWGDLHSHSVFSDGMGGDADYLYTYARDAADLDVCASADHAPREPSRLATRKYHAPGRFVTLWGYEWAEAVPGRLDRNIYLHSEEDPIPEGWPPTIEGFWKSIEKLYGDNKDHRVIVGPHMFTYQTKCRPWYETWDPRYERFVEIYSQHGMSEYLGNPRPLAAGKVQEGFFMQDGLKAGRRFGIIASSDTHNTRPGRSGRMRYSGGLVAFLAKDLTRESIWDAFWNRRVYAATNDRVFIDFTIDGHRMGEEFVATGKPRIRYTVHGCEDDFTVHLLRNNTEIRRSAAKGGSVAEEFTDETFDSGSWYYLRVVQANGEWAWSSPIWVDRAP